MLCALCWVPWLQFRALWGNHVPALEIILLKPHQLVTKTAWAILCSALVLCLERTRCIAAAFLCMKATCLTTISSDHSTWLHTYTFCEIILVCALVRLNMQWCNVDMEIWMHRELFDLMWVLFEVAFHWKEPFACIDITVRTWTCPPRLCFGWWPSTNSMVLGGWADW